MNRPVDPLDVGARNAKLWAEFCMSFASSCLQLAILEDFHDKAEEYLTELDSRWYTAFLHAQALKEEDPEYDGSWLLFDREQHGAVFIPAEIASLLFDQLFPVGHTASDLFQATLGLLSVGLHSALESFTDGHGVTTGKLPLPEAISAWLTRERKQPDLEARTSDLLVGCDATRHVYVHNRGIVDAKYVNRVKNNRFVEGERRRLSLQILDEFRDAAWRAAVRVRDAV